jgi:hypothetical protein
MDDTRAYSNLAGALLLCVEAEAFDHEPCDLWERSAPSARGAHFAALRLGGGLREAVAIAG